MFHLDFNSCVFGAICFERCAQHVILIAWLASRSSGLLTSKGQISCSKGTCLIRLLMPWFCMVQLFILGGAILILWCQWKCYFWSVVFCFMHCETHHVFCYKELCLQYICLTTLGHLAGRVPRGQGRMNLQKRKQQPCSTNWWKALVFGAKEGQKKYGTPFLKSLVEILLKIFPRGADCMEKTDAVCFYRSYRNTPSVPNYRSFFAFLKTSFLLCT